MSRNRNAQSAVRRAALMALVVAVSSWGTAGCGRNIGDACTTSADCDPSGGTRTCDLSQPGGYCLIDGCDARSCPDESFCARFFPELFLTSPAGSVASACTPPDEQPTTCAPDETCVSTGQSPAAGAPVGVCARRSWEKRACVHSCRDNGDCRTGYTCRMTGENGTQALTLTMGEKASFCAPAPPAAN